MSVRLGRFIERNAVLPITLFAYRKGLGTYDALRVPMMHPYTAKCIGDWAGGYDHAD